MAELVTTRLSLVAPDPGTSEPVDLADHLADNWAKIDASIGAFPCTEATKPGSPFDGQIIRTTDTRRVYVYNATQTRWEQVLGATICTSATRPTNVTDGLFIRETDTSRVYVRNDTGATWDRMAKFADIATELAASNTWQTFAGVTWTATGTAPSLGNGILKARYTTIGKVCTFRFRLLMGSTTTYGTGAWRILLPFTSFSDADAPYSMGAAYFRDASITSNGHMTGVCIVDTGTNFLTFNCNTGGSTGSQVQPTIPFTWANTDHLSGTITYEIA